MSMWLGRIVVGDNCTKVNWSKVTVEWLLVCRPCRAAFTMFPATPTSSGRCRLVNDSWILLHWTPHCSLRYLSPFPWLYVKKIKPCVIISHHEHDLVCYINTDHQVSVQLPVCWFESDAFDCKLRNDIIRKDFSFMVLTSLATHTIISDSWILDLWSSL